MEEVNLNIDYVSPGDYQSVADIYNEYILLGNATMEENTYDFDRVNNWVAHFSEKEKMLVLKKGSAIIGWGVIKKYSDREGYKYTCETSVYITQNERAKGFGSLLKKRLIHECKRLEYHHIVAKIFASNIASLEYNKKLGYKLVGVQKEIGIKNGHWIDVAILQYIIQ